MFICCHRSVTKPRDSAVFLSQKCDEKSNKIRTMDTSSQILLVFPSYILSYFEMMIISMTCPISNLQFERHWEASFHNGLGTFFWFSSNWRFINLVFSLGRIQFKFIFHLKKSENF